MQQSSLAHTTFELPLTSALPMAMPAGTPPPLPATAAGTIDQLCAHCRQPGNPGSPHAFAGQPACSIECLESLLRADLAREHALSTAAALETGPRVRIGQILVEQGVITEAQLERALRSQRLTGAGRLGTWLRQQTQLPEEDFAAALSIQWGCPVFRVGAFAPDKMVSFLPRALVESLGALPLRLSREPERLTICFEDRLDYELLRGCERMHGLPVEGGLLASNEFWYGSGELLKAAFPPARLVEATSLEEMVGAMVETMSRATAVDARLVFVRGYYWLRLWVAPTGVRDILCTLRPTAEQAPDGQLAEEMSEGLGAARARATQGG